MDPIVIVGGGIAGTTCALTLAEIYPGDIAIITISQLVKVTKDLKKTGRNLEDFTVEEIDATDSENRTLLGKKIRIILGLVVNLDSEEKSLIYLDLKLASKRTRLKYLKLCICAGARPKKFPFKLSTDVLKDKILSVRDTQSVETLKSKLESSRRLVLVGNGGIALELAYVIKKCQIVWVIKEDFIGATFFDSGAAKFFLDSLKLKEGEKSGTYCEDEISLSKSFRFSTYIDKTSINTKETFSSALGPDWIQDLELIGSSDFSKTNKNLIIKGSTSLSEVRTGKPTSVDESWPIEVEMTNGTVVGCDLIVCAIGVEPCIDWLKSSISLERSTIDGGILIDTQMKTSVSDIYAAGDVASCEHWPANDLWSQMRLWTHARQMGQYSAQCMIEHMQNGDPSIYFNFDCFTHITKFFGYRVVLLGSFNAQNLEDYEIIVRLNPPRDYVKLVLRDGRLKGAILVGDTGLEETFENLINDQIDVSRYGERLLDGTVDIEDYFD